MSDLRAALLRPWRTRFGLFALGVLIVIAVAGAIVWREVPEAARGSFVGFAGIAALLMLGLVYWLYHCLTNDLLRPLLALGRDLEAQTHSGVAIDQQNYKGSLIAPFVDDLAHDLAGSAAGDLAGQEALGGSSKDTNVNWLSELLHVLDQGIIVASMSHEILLINSRAREMLGRNTALALGRDLNDLLDIQTINHAIERQSDEDAVGSERLFCRFKRNETIMPARFSLIHDGQGDAIGYALAFHDFTNALYRTQELETGYDQLLQEARDFTAEVSLLRMAGVSTHEAEQRFSQKLIVQKSNATSLLGHAWPKGRMTLRNLLRVLSDRVGHVEVPATAPERVFLRCDGAAIVETLENLLNSLHDDGFELALNFSVEGDQVKFQIASSEQKIPIGDVEDAMQIALTRLPTAPTGDEVLRAHGTEIWPHMEDDTSQLVFILKRVETALTAQSARPEYYDFEVRSASAELMERPLRELPIVVFDSETTGLDPKGGDRVVQLSAVRVKSGKMIRDESFDELVNPERNIPLASTKIHGITDKMVHNAPHFDAVAREFHEYCHGEVLMAHNAAFDMAFLRKGADAAGIEFPQPVLDTVFMSAFLFDYSGKHTLDDLTKRFGIIIPPQARHTALGDAVATAEVFIKMLPMLEARGVHTLGQMLEIGTQMRDIRKRQDVYG